MRTTVDIHDDILSVSKELEKAANITAGEIISGLASKALTQPRRQIQYAVEEPSHTTA